MSFFKFDEEKVVSGFELVAEGKYEATVLNAVAGKTQKGEDKITLDYEIRSDVPQKHQGAKIMFDTFTFSNEIAAGIVQSLLKATGFANGHPFQSPQDMANQLIGRSLQITVKHEEYEKLVDGKKEKRTSAKAKYYDKSIVNPPASPGAPITVGSDDLPF
ncbi:DUF669 domain-containing protein [Lysinibacillus fusiformis]|uniref:DUF669 domain-containing protein n=1 Tax=Lysinibacillus fusiformis TaxID=28031 RepID=UPI002D772724|nr:DUF669 domain-containing protein [Lysinibacillus fusiformis]WRS99915.1 DUF669 domain-containing protein [Lysinibacillus fusiformis]